MIYNYKFLLVFTLGITLRILSNPWILSWFGDNYSIHKNKIYDAILIASFTCIALILIDNSLLTNAEMIFLIIIFVCVAAIFNYAIKNQIFISDKDYIYKLKEDNKEAIKLSNVIMSKKNINPKFKDYLIQNNELKQQSINELNELLKNF